MSTWMSKSAQIGIVWINTHVGGSTKTRQSLLIYSVLVENNMHSLLVKLEAHASNATMFAYVFSQNILPLGDVNHMIFVAPTVTVTPMDRALNALLVLPRWMHMTV